MFCRFIKLFFVPCDRFSPPSCTLGIGRVYSYNYKYARTGWKESQVNKFAKILNPTLKKTQLVQVQGYLFKYKYDTLPPSL